MSMTGGPAERPSKPVHPVIWLVLATLMFVAVFFVGVAILEPVADSTKDRVGADYHSAIDNILAAVLQYSVPLFFFTVFGWGMFWYLRRERQTRRL